MKRQRSRNVTERNVGMSGGARGIRDARIEQCVGMRGVGCTVSGRGGLGQTVEHGYSSRRWGEGVGPITAGEDKQHESLKKNDYPTVVWASIRADNHGAPFSNGKSIAMGKKGAENLAIFPGLNIEYYARADLSGTGDGGRGVQIRTTWEALFVVVMFLCRSSWTKARSWGRLCCNGGINWGAIWRT